MNVTLGNLLYFIKMNNSEVRQKTSETGKFIKDLDAKFNDSKKVVKQWGQDFKNSIKQVNDFAQKNKGAIQAVAVASGIALTGLVMEIKKATKENIEFKNSMLGLKSVAKGVGVDIDAVTKAARDLTADGLMSISDAATGLKNLLISGYGLDEAIILMQRFKDSAAFGRQGALSFGEAITSATEGIKNGNSVLVDNAGVTKNLSVMLQEAGYSAQDLMRASDDAGVRMAIFNGIVKETRHQVGDAGKLADTFSGALSKSEENMRRLHRALGDAVEGPLASWLNKINDITSKTADWVEKNKDLAGSLTLMTTGMAAAVLGGSTLLLALDRIIKVVKTAKTLFLDTNAIFAIKWVASGGKATEAIGLLAGSFAPFLVGGVIILGLTVIVKLLNQIKTNADNAKIEAMDLSKATVDELSTAADYWQGNIDKLTKTKAELEAKVKESESKPTYAPAYAPGLLGVSATSITVNQDLERNKDALIKLQGELTNAQNKLKEAQKYLKSSETPTQDPTVIPAVVPGTASTSVDDLNKLQERLMIERLNRQKRFREAEIEEERQRYAEEYQAAKGNAGLLEQIDQGHRERLLAIDQKYTEEEDKLIKEERQRNQDLADEIVQMTGTKEEQEELYLQRRKEQLQEAGHTYQQILDWETAYHKQKLQEQTANQAGWIADIITRQRTLEDAWKDLMNRLVKEYIQNFLLKIKEANSGGQAGGSSGGGGWANVISALDMIFSFSGGGIVPAASRGMLAPAASNGMVLPPSFGTDTVLTALTPKEMVLPVDLSEGLQNMIRQGSQPQNIYNNETNYYVDAIDQQSFAQALYKNKDSVIGIYQEDRRRGGVTRRGDED